MLLLVTSGWANSQAIPIDEQKPRKRAINADLTRKRSRASIEKISLKLAEEATIWLLTGKRAKHGQAT